MNKDIWQTITETAEAYQLEPEKEAVETKLRLLLNRLRQYEGIMTKMADLPKDPTVLELREVFLEIQKELITLGIDRIRPIKNLPAHNAASIRMDDQGFLLAINPEHPNIQPLSLTTLKEYFHELVAAALLDDLVDLRTISGSADLEEKKSVLYLDEEQRTSLAHVADTILAQYVNKE